MNLCNHLYYSHNHHNYVYDLNKQYHVNVTLDEKIIAVPIQDPTYKDYYDIQELPKHIFDEMSHFFSVYKSLEEKETVIDEMKGREEAIAIVERCIDRYIDNFCKGRISE